MSFVTAKQAEKKKKARKPGKCSFTEFFKIKENVFWVNIVWI